MNQRYARQIVLPEIGESGQKRLSMARILIVGAGGLGSPAMLYLAAAGVGLRPLGGCIGIIDDDTVDTTNLQRQIVYQEADKGVLKVVAAEARLKLLNSEIEIVTHAERLDENNIEEILNHYDLVIDGSDNFSTKYLLNDAAVKLAKPVVYGSILGFEGQVAVFWPGHGPCYRCIYPEQSRSHIPNCAEAGTLGGIAGVIGSMQAIEACKVALGIEHCKKFGIEPLIGRILVIDALTWDIRRLDLSKREDCLTCSIDPSSIELLSNNSVMCATSTRKPITINEFNELLDSGIPITLIDVREKNEWESGHLDGAIHVPLGILLANVDDLEQIDPASLVVVYCQHGIRSAHAAAFLTSKGYEALNLLVDWPS